MRGSTRCPPSDRPPVNVVRFAFQTMVGIGTLLAAARRWSTSYVWLRRRRLPRSRWFYRALVAAGPALGRRADRRLGHDRGRPPAVGRLRRDAHRRGGHRRRAESRSATRRSSLVYAGLLVAVVWILRRLARAPLDRRARERRAAAEPRSDRGAAMTSTSSAPARARRARRLRGARRRRLRRRLLAAARRPRRARRARSASTPTASMGPVWEANHVWLIFVLVVCWTALPGGVRVDRLDARDPAVHRRASGSSCAAPPTRCVGDGRDARATRDRHRVRRSPRS